MATLLVLNNRNEGEWYTIPSHRPLTVGRDDELLAELLDERVSRRHMEVRFDGPEQRYYAVDLYSKNGVRLNGERLNGFAPIDDDDVLQVGHTLMVFTLSDFDDDDDAQRFIVEAKDRHAEELEAVEHRKAERERKEAAGGTVTDGITGWLTALLPWRRG